MTAAAALIDVGRPARLAALRGALRFVVVLARGRPRLVRGGVARARAG